MFHYDKVTNKRTKMLDIDGFGRHFNNLNAFQIYLNDFGVDITANTYDKKKMFCY